MFKCEICGKEFETSNSISQHIVKGHKISQEEYYLKYVNAEKAKCKTCGKYTRFYNLQTGYNKFCSYKCAAIHPETREKTKQTSLKKYGVGNPNQNSEVKKKKKETYMKNLGVENPMQNPYVRKKKKYTTLKKLGVEYATQNKDVINKQQETALKNNNGVHPNKLTFQKLKERYPLLVEVEELIEGPNGEIMGHCKNASCKNSKENGGYFEPTIYQLNWRKQGIDKNDTYYLYCCEECKKACPLYGKSAAVINNHINENKEILYTQKEYNIWHEEVLYRQRIENNTEINFCEYCHTTEKLHVHHEVPQKLVPGYALDPINGIIFCEDCHYKIGHEKGTECSTGNLANKICK